MPCKATQDGQVIVKNSDRMWSTGGGNGKPLQYSCYKNPVNCMKRQRDMTLEDEPPPCPAPRSKGIQFATGEKQRAITNSFRRNEAAGTTQKWCSVVDMSGGESQVWCCKEQYCTGTWNVRSMNQSKLDMVRHETAIVNTDIFVISELLIKWMGMGKFNSDDYYIYYRTSL